MDLPASDERKENDRREDDPIESASIGHRLAIRRTILQVLGIGLMGLAGVADRVEWSEPTVPTTPVFLVAGLLVFLSAFAMRRYSAESSS